MEQDYSTHSLRSRKRIYQNIHYFAQYKRSANEKELSFLANLGDVLKLNSKQCKLLSAKGQRGELVKTVAKKERKLLLDLLLEFLSLQTKKPALTDQKRLINFSLQIAVGTDTIQSFLEKTPFSKKMHEEVERLKKSESYFEKRFPGLMKKKRWCANGLEFIVYEKERTTTSHTCFGYGGECGTDVSTTFSSTLVLLPNLTFCTTEKYVSFYVSGYSSISDRYDQDSVSIDCRFADGSKMELRKEYYYQKYGGRSDNSWGELEKLGEYLHKELGYTQISAEELRVILQRMCSAFS